MTTNDTQNNETIAWARQYLVSHGYTLKTNNPEIIQNTPWSHVARFATTKGYIYLKQTPPLLGLEANILQKLHNQFHISVPKVIAHDPAHHCFLMEDAGISLRSILKRQFDLELFCRAILHFTAMQLAVANALDVFIDMGVPDWRLEKIPELYAQLLAQEEMLLADGLSEYEIAILKEHIPNVLELCRTLSTYAIKPSIVQPDFNDNNTLIDETSQAITIIDLGEIVISHPVFSWINCLDQAKKHYDIKEDDAYYIRLRDACFENYLVYETKERLLKAFSVAQPLYFIYGALGCHRLMTACDKEKFTSSFRNQGKVSIPLKEFITFCNSN